jgi:hypothetical protein
MSSVKAFGFNKKTIMAIGLALAGVIIVVLLWNVLALHKGPAIFYMAESLGNLCAVLGIMLYLSDRGVLGMLLVLVQVLQIAITRLVYSMSFVKSFYFWTFTVVLIAFVVIFFWPPVGTGVKSK